MKHTSIAIVVVLTVGVFAVIGDAATQGSAPAKNTANRRCEKGRDGRFVCFCGANKVMFHRWKGERCVNGNVVSRGAPSKLVGLRLATKSIHQSTRDDKEGVQFCGLYYKPRVTEVAKTHVPLRNVSVEAWIDSFAADVTLTQVFVNQEENPIEAVYVFPIEENAAVYSFTAQIDDRTITAVLKEKKAAEKEYESAVQQGQTAVLLRQSQETLDTFTINIGALPPGKECQVKIQYVTELDLIDGNAIRFVVPTTIAPRYNPSLGHIQLPDKTDAAYVQKTPYSMSFQAHVLRGEEHKISQVANLSHPVNVSRSQRSIDVSIEATTLDRDIILDIDLPANRPSALASIEQYNQSAQHAILLAFTPTLSDFMKISNGHDETNTEFIFIVDCSGSMMGDNQIGLAKEAMLLFIRSLPVGSKFNIIRFGSHYDILFKGESLTTVYNEQTAKTAEDLTRSMAADFGGTELLEPLQHVKRHPPVHGHSRQIFLLTDGEISNTDEVINLCRSLSSTTRIFSFGLGSSPSRSLVKGLARATNGYFVFVPPSAKVDTYVGSQFGRALQPSLVNARLEWHGLAKNGSQSPESIPPLYVNDRVLVYGILDGEDLERKNVSVDLFVGEHKISSIKLPRNIAQKKDTIRRLAAKALIQELQHKRVDPDGDDDDDSSRKQRITALSLNHGILSPYTAFVGVENTTRKNNNTRSTTRHVPIQISQGSEHLFDSVSSYSSYNLNYMAPMPMMSMAHMSPYPQQAPIQSLTGHYRPAYRQYGSGLNGPSSMSSGYRAPSAMGAPGFALSYDDSQQDMAPAPTTTTTRSPPSGDHVRWLIDQQSFNGAWKLDDDDVKKLTNGKSLSAFTSTVTSSRDALSTALAIAVLESKYANQKTLWYAVATKGRKHLQTFRLSNSQVDQLINDLKKNL